MVRFPHIVRITYGEVMAESDLDTAWFLDRLADKQMSQRQLARLLGVDHASVYRLLRGKRQMRMKEAATFAALLGVEVSEVLAHAGVRIGDTGDKTVALIGTIDGEGEIHIDCCAEHVPAPADIPDDAAAVRVQAQAGPYALLDGWIYICAKPAPPSPEAIGRMCAVKIKNGVTLMRFVRRGYRPGTYNLLTSTTAVGMENAELEWVAPVLIARPS